MRHEREIEFYFKGYTAFSATIKWCYSLQLTRLAQMNWAGHLQLGDIIHLGYT
jgi:hypothetical protein